MADNYSIRVDNLSKKFGLTLRRSMSYGLQDSLRRLTGMKGQNELLRDGEFWAVNDVSFELQRGESLGIMGPNGCGKTTLLRVLNGIYAPDTGRIEMRGRIGALIAAGAGFAPMLTGRENVHINGTLLGMTPRQIRSRMDEIIAFAELEQFADMPVKNYSSGMFVRLGFAIAAMSEPDILLVDEVLAVGDLNFQKKCFDYLFRLKRNGTSIVLVSHSIGAIWSMCDRGLFMHHGEAVVSGSVEDVIREYDQQNARNSLASAIATREAHDRAETNDSHPQLISEDQSNPGELVAEYGHNRGGTGDAAITSIQIFDDNGIANLKTELDFGQSFRLEANLVVNRPIDEPIIRFAIDAMHYRFISVIDSLEQGLPLARIEAGTYRIRVDIPRQNFRPGAYKVNCALVGRHSGVHIFYWFNAAQFQVMHPKDTFLYADDNAVLHLNTRFELHQ